MASNVSRKPFATGWTTFAACLMIFGGAMAVLEGIGAIVNDERYVITGNYVYKFNVTGWGWLHLILGLLIVVAGFMLFTGAMWARILGVVAAGLNMIVNFLWLPYYPFWAIVLIAIDIFVIWALTAGTHREAHA
ncbi:hypothetical protein [Streptomyces sp. CB01881]|uniref:DUF7144 family membrane protein n=1 Tax=Streptomyces sp. CB01881 TaxID=2078691 RepID=UPI000CDC3900|nr:hypothetical protein [Streptomyces sp. CB01881]AUY48238.1 hypothetical protein C2142_03860 [Streptomyces sp. CB01881]TYC76728.1 hypothetical protein EH183_03870 [Streptomyces sp. CB01881]